MHWRKSALVLVAIAVSLAVVGYFIYSAIYGVRDVSLRDVASDPQSFDGVHVRLRGHVVDTSVYMFGPKYVLRDVEEEVDIALGGKGGPGEVDLEPYVSFVFDGENYTQIRDINVSIVGHVRYIGWVTDAPPFLLEVENVEPELGVLEAVVIEFLSSTDVSKSGWDCTVEIKKICDNRLGGVVIVVEYTTASAVHPHFMAEAIEHHTAVITIDEIGKVTSALCIWGSFHDNRVWDLINQKWIEREYFLVF